MSKVGSRTSCELPPQSTLSLTRRVVCKDVLCGVQAWESTGRRYSAPDECVGCSQVVEQPRGLVGVCWAHSHVEDAACPLIGLKEGLVSKEAAQLLDHVGHVLCVCGGGWVKGGIQVNRMSLKTLDRSQINRYMYHAL